MTMWRKTKVTRKKMMTKSGKMSREQDRWCDECGHPTDSSSMNRKCGGAVCVNKSGNQYVEDDDEYLD